VAAADDEDDHGKKEAPYDHGKGSTKVNLTQPRNILDQQLYSPEEDEEDEVVDGQERGRHTPRSSTNRQEIAQQAKMRRWKNDRKARADLVWGDR
jgi:hypothetical protein